MLRRRSNIQAMATAAHLLRSFFEITKPPLPTPMKAICLFALVFAFASPPHLRATVPTGKTQHLTSPDQVPEGLAQTDWAGIRAAYEAGKHVVAAGDDGNLVARNPGQQWRTTFDGRGFTTVPDSGGWSWGLELTSYGFDMARKVISGKASVTHSAGQVSYQWDGNLCEWFLNDTRGMQQGWTISQRPAGAGANTPLHFDFSIRGGLGAQVSSNGDGISFMKRDGSSVLTYGGLKAWDADGKDLEVHFEVAGEGEARITVVESEARYPITIDPVAQQAYLKSSNTDALDEFGTSVAVDGDTIVVGAYREQSNANGINGNQSDNSTVLAGAAYVFVRTGGMWTQQAYLKASNTGQDAEFGHAVAISGDTIVVGSPREDSNATGVNGNQGNHGLFRAGAAYVFTRSGTVWTQQAYLKASNSGDSDEFGTAVAVSGDTIVVGAPEEDSNATGVNGNQANNSLLSVGAAYVFNRSAGTWSQQAYLKASNSGEGDFFGLAVAVSGDTVVVGSPYEDSNATGVNGSQADNSTQARGAAYVFIRAGGAWSQQAYLKASHAEPDPPFVPYSDEFGFSVGVSGDTIIVGAPSEDSIAIGVNGDETDDSANESGAAYVFTRNGAVWTQQAYLKASNTRANGGAAFGTSVSISSNIAVVGAPGEFSDATGINGNQASTAAQYSGAAYVFARNGSSWTQREYVKQSNTGYNDESCGSVAVSGDTLVFGAPGEDSNAIGINGNQANNSSSRAGAAYVVAGVGTIAPAPEIDVEQPSGTNLVDGTGSVDFGSSDTGVATSWKTFTIRNSGNADLTGIAITKTGVNSADFTVTTTGMLSTLAGGASTSFSVNFKPGAVGAREAAVHIASNDADENPFDIALTGTGVPPTFPEIAVEQPLGTSLVDSASSLDFGSVGVGVGAVKTFTIKNFGTADLTGLAVSKDGTHAVDFTVGALGATSLAPGASTTFEVTFAPAASGAHNTAVHIASNDADENPFDVALSGTGLSSTSADLSNLLLSTGALTPAFASGTVSYTASVPYSTSTLTVTPTTAQANATITVNGTSVVSGAASGSIALTPGDNLITLNITAHDGITIKTYTVTVNRNGLNFSSTGSLATGRSSHTAALLPSGKVLAVGGLGSGGALASAELYDPASGSWSATGALATARYLSTATLLANGKVLVAGGRNDINGYLASAELYDPATGSWSVTGSLNTARYVHTATLLANGKVLVVGGQNSSGYSAAVELYDPATGTWSTTGTLSVGRYAHTATLLASGKLLVVGGYNGSSLATAELYDPATGAWSNAGTVATARQGHTTMRLPDGKVLIAGGTNVSTSIASAELYDPTTGMWSATGSLIAGRYNATATLLPNGKVLITAGTNTSSLASAELYNPATGTWSATSALNTAHGDHPTATLLPSGKVLVAGGQVSGINITSSELYDSATGSYSATGSLANARNGHTTLQLPNGRVLAIGGGNGSGGFRASAELYDPTTGTWTATGSLASARAACTATLLLNGKVLAVGGANGNNSYVASAEIYDPATGAWTAAGSLATGRHLHSATLLPNGKVLVTGGEGTAGRLASAELYDPTTGTWSSTGSLSTLRYQHSATLLPNGKVLVAGGYSSSVLASAEIYNPATGTWSATGSLAAARLAHTATLLPNGKVLVAGGNNGSYVGSAELYNPTTGTWSATASLATGRYLHTATLLPNGKVLVTAGHSSSPLASAELYDPAFGTWSVTGSLATARYDFSATLLANGKVLASGGFTGSVTLGGAELYDVGLGFSAATQPLITSATFNGAGGLVLTGTGFTGVSSASNGNGGQDSPTNYPVVQVRRLDNEQSTFLLRDPTASSSATSFTSATMSGFPFGYYAVTVFTNGTPSTAAAVALGSPSPLTMIPPVFANWNLQANGAWAETAEGLKLNGSGNRLGNTIASKDAYDLTNASVYFKWKAHGNASYMSAAPRIIPGSLSPGLFTTHHSYLGSKVITDGIWYYTRFRFTGDITWSAITCTGNYDDSGGTVFSTNTETLGAASAGVKSANITLGFNDNFGGTSAYVVLGEAKTTGRKLELSSTQEYGFENNSLIPGMTVQGTWSITTNAHGSPKALQMLVSTGDGFTLPLTDTAMISFDINHNCNDGIELSLDGESVYGLGGAGAAQWYHVDLALPPSGSHELKLLVYSGAANGTYINDGKTIIMDNVVLYSTPTAPSITTGSPLPSATIGVAYDQAMAATGGATPYEWSIVSGNVPGLSMAADGVLSGTPTAMGTSTFTVQVTGNDGLMATKSFSLTVGASTLAEIVVEQPTGTPLVNGSSNIDFGSVNAGTSSTMKTFTLRNTGPVSLTGIAFSKDGANAAEFTLNTTGIATTLAAGASKTFTVVFTPAGLGARDATLHIASSDNDENPFDIALTGTGLPVGPGPEILVQQASGTSVTDGSGNIDFGTASSGTGGSDQIFTVTNIGTADLIISGVTISGGNVADFTVDSSGMDSSVTSGESTTFTVTFSPSATGLRTTTLHIGSNDTNENPFDINLKGTGTAPEIGITGNNVAIADGDTTPSAADHTDFGTVGITGGTLVRTFTIANTGTAVLNLTGTPLVEITGDDAADFTVTTDPNVELAAAGKTTFRINFDPMVLGLRSATVSIANDDPNEDPYTFAISGVGKDIPRDFSTEAGSYNGLVQASSSLPDPDGTSPSVGTEGFLSATVANTGVFTGKLTLDGLVLSVTGAFDNTGVARFGASSGTSLTVARTGKPSLIVALSLDLDPPPDASGKLTGTVTQSNRSMITAVSTVEAERSHYNGTNVVVPDYYLTIKGASKTDGVFSAVIAARTPYDEMDPEHTQIPGLSEVDYPQATGVATAKISKAGVVSLVGTLADGTPFTASTPLSQAKRGGLFVSLYKMGGFISGWLALDENEADSDFSVVGLSWCRPYTDSQHYPFGWPEIIKTDLHAAKYNLTAGESALPDLLPTDGNMTANAQIQWTGGGLQEGLASKAVNISPADVVAKVPPTDTSFSLTITRATGLMSGTFTHSDATKPPFQGVVYQKGSLAGGHGFFLSSTPKMKDYNGQSGGVSLKPDLAVPEVGELAVTASFTESFRETLKTIIIPESPPTYLEFPSGSTSFTVVGTLSQGFLPAFGEETNVGVELGGYSHSATLGEATTLSLTGRRAVFKLTGIDPNDPNGIREITIATISYAWTATSITVTGTLSLEAGGISAMGHSEDIGPIAESVNAALTFDLVVGSRDVHVTGTSTPSVRKVGPADFPEEYTLSNVSIKGSTDFAKPICAITTPAASARIPGTLGGDVTVKGSASDTIELSYVSVRLNGGDWEPADLTFKQIGKDEFDTPILSTTVATWSTTLMPLPGPNLLEAMAVDGDDNESVIATRSFQYVVPSPLQVDTDGEGTISKGFGGPSSREMGVTYTVVAIPKQGFVFDHWTVSDGVILEDIGVTEADLEKPTLKFIFMEGLVLTAKFIENPFIIVAGNYNGLVQASALLPDPDGTLPSVSTEGFVTAAVLSTGAFTGKLTIDGLVLNVAGTFDTTGMARFGAERALSLAVARAGKSSLNVALKLDLKLPPEGTGQLTGTVSQNTRGVINAVSDVVADRAYYNGTSQVVPDEYLTVKGTNKTDGIFTSLFISQSYSYQPPGFTNADYPQGRGFATVKVSKAGLVSLAGTLADGTTITTSAPLSEAKTWPLFAQLYNKAGFIRGQVALEIGAESDMSAVDMLWSRPFIDGQHYPYGWPECIKVDFLGAKYAVPANASVLPDLPIADGDGNVALTFTDGLLTDTVTNPLNLSTADVVTKIPTTDASYTLTINRATGLLTGTFTHTNGTKPSFQGIIYQKAGSPNSGGHGFFLTPIPAVKDYTGESGGVTLIVY